MRAPAQNQQFQSQAQNHIARTFFTFHGVGGLLYLARGLPGRENQLVHVVPGRGISHYSVPHDVELSFNVVPLDRSPGPALLAQSTATMYRG